MTETHVPIQDVKNMVNTVDAGDPESVKSFLHNVQTQFKDVPAEERARRLSIVTQELEQKGILPQLLVNAGLGDTKSGRFKQMRDDDYTSYLSKGDLEAMSQGKKGFSDVDAAAQFLAGAVLRHLDEIRNGSSSDYLSTSQMKKWADREGSELPQRLGVENALLQWDSLKDKLGDSPKIDDVKALLKADDFTKNKMLSQEQRNAAQFMLDHFDTIRSIDNSSFRPYSYDNWISKDKLEYWGKSYLHTSGETAQTHKQEREQLAKQENEEAAVDKKRQDDAKKPSSEAERIQQLEAQIRKLQEQLQTRPGQQQTKPSPEAPKPNPEAPKPNPEAPKPNPEAPKPKPEQSSPSTQGTPRTRAEIEKAEREEEEKAKRELEEYLRGAGLRS